MATSQYQREVRMRNHRTLAGLAILVLTALAALSYTAAWLAVQ